MCLILEKTFEAVTQSIVALGSRISVHQEPNAPVFPTILGTGFVVDSRGIIATNRHVAEPLLQLPPHPVTNQSSAFAMFVGPLMHLKGNYVRGVFFTDIKDYVILDHFDSDSPFYGEAVPDIAFLQLDVCELPSLNLATEQDTWRVGMSIATAGYAMGKAALVVYGKVNQITPLLRHGIISSVYPYPAPNPHGFTTDIMTQGGESGSPIFLPNSPSVVGLLHAGFDYTNITMGIPSWLVQLALDDCLKHYPLDFCGSPTLKELMSNPDPKEGLHFEKVIVPPPTP